jgi:cysteine desulfurase / selenocysteine lyase
MLKEFFPIFTHTPNLVYLDSGVTTLKPKKVLDRLGEYYEFYSANIHRGLYGISERATKEYDYSRQVVANFIGAKTSSEVIFTKGATQSLNMLARCIVPTLTNSDEVVTTILEHHSNFVPWQQITKEYRVTFKVLMANSLGQLDNIETVVTGNTKVFTITHISNVLGNVLPLQEIIKKVKEISPKCLVVVDGCQAIAHTHVQVQELGCDAYVFSGHKLYAPTGIGVLWAKEELLNAWQPCEYGGDMIEEVSIEKTTFASVPNKFEAGTPPIAEAIALGAAIEYIQEFDHNNLEEKERELVQYTRENLGDIQDIVLVSNKDALSIVTFYHKKVHAHDIAQMLGQYNICIRAGHHCAQPLHTLLNISATCRVSFGMYNTKRDVDAFAEKFREVIGMFL